jgi:hypothetical protein
MNIDAHFVETSSALFLSRVVRSIGTVDPLASVHTRLWGDAIAMISGPRYPFNQVAGVFDLSFLPGAQAYFRTHDTPLSVECSSRTQSVPEILALHDAGLVPYPALNVWTCETYAPKPRTAASNLVWTTSSDNPVAVDHIASDSERVIRHAYAMQPDATFVSILHGDGVIASAGMRVQEGYGFWLIKISRKKMPYLIFIKRLDWVKLLLRLKLLKIILIIYFSMTIDIIYQMLVV